MPDVMISYARRDAKQFAGRLAEALKGRNVQAWLDTTDVPGGAQWLRQISSAVEQCTVFIAVQSKAGSESEWVLRERLMALDLRKPIIPVFHLERIRDFELIDRQPIDFTDGFDQKLPYLVEQIQRYATGTLVHEPVDQRQLELAYLGKVLAEHKLWQQVYTPMAGVGRIEVQVNNADDSDDDDDIEMVVVPTAIDNVFSQLDTRLDDQPAQQVERQAQRFEDILPAVDTSRRLLVLGDPGAGKTTTLWRIVADYAEQALNDPTAPLPVFLRLGELDAGTTLRQAMARQLGELGAHVETLRADGRLAFLLDGLNEIERDIEAQTIADIRALVDACQQHDHIVVVTCRELDYTDARQLNITDQIVITPLDPIRIRRFVNNYIRKPAGKGDELFWQLAGERATWYWESFTRHVGEDYETFWLADRLEDNQRWPYDFGRKWDNWYRERQNTRTMLELARNPYMLFMMTRVFTKQKRLPANRGLLFKGFVDYLLLDREKLAVDVAASLKGQLAALAFNMQRSGEGTSVGQAEALHYLADETALYQAQSAHILTSGDQVRFSHQLLQEYFAAQLLDKERHLRPVTDFFPSENWWEPTNWAETAILLAGLYSDDCTEIVAWLQDANPELAARCIKESGAHTPMPTLDQVRDRWLPRFTDEAGEPEARARAAVGRALGRLDLDTRRGVGLTADGLPDMDWVEIPAGKFIYGDDDKEGYSRYAPPADRQELELDTFYISRYLLTYRQFQAFIDAPDGFGDARWWAGLAADAGHKDSPGEQAFKYWNHPRERVSWYDAMAFCRWLSYRLTGVEPDLDAVLSWPVRLPTEQEWEKAARGTDGRRYPYGNTFDAAKGNTSEGGIGLTSAVGMYPSGASPYGVLDMSGNVWEWCLTSYSDGDNQNMRSGASRVLRGGSFNFARDLARCGSRLNPSPNLSSNAYGIRFVVACPPS